MSIVPKNLARPTTIVLVPSLDLIIEVPLIVVVSNVSSQAAQLSRIYFVRKNLSCCTSTRGSIAERTLRVEKKPNTRLDSNP